MRMPAAVRLCTPALLALVTACSAPTSPPGADAPVSRPPSSATPSDAASAAPTAAAVSTAAAVPTAAAEGAVDAPALVACLGHLPRGATVTVEKSPEGTAVNVDVARPDLSKGVNRITAFELPNRAAAAEFAPGAQAFGSANGGGAVAVGKWVVGKPFGGDDDIEAAVRRCAAG